jgi:hypothetical protein
MEDDDIHILRNPFGAYICRVRNCLNKKKNGRCRLPEIKMTGYPRKCVSYQPLPGIDNVRIDICNRIIEEISKHGRRFFSEGTFKVGFELKEGKLYYRDNYTGKLILVGRNCMKFTNNAFSHGGTLEGMIKNMRDFIYTGEKQTLPLRYSAYDYESLKIIHHLAKDLGYSETANFVLHHYGTNEDQEYHEDRG